MTYQAKMTPAADSGYDVTFPDLPGCFTCGENLDDALRMAKEVLDLWLSYLDDENIDIPEAQRHRGKNIHLISVDPKIAFSITLKKERKRQDLTQQALAEKAGMALAQYAKLENRKKANPTLTTIAKLNVALGGGIIFGL